MHNGLSRRTVLFAAIGLAQPPLLLARQGVAIEVSKDPGCGCCEGWIAHLRSNGFDASAIDTSDMSAVKKRLGVPPALASCHTATIDGYVIEGHVPAIAIRQLLATRPRITGLAAPGMPIGSPGMEGGTPEVYDVVAWAPGTQSVFGRYRGADPV